LTIGKGSTLYVSNVAFENMQNMRQYRSYCESGAIAATM
jgi:hypothetical protein